MRIVISSPSSMFGVRVRLTKPLVAILDCGVASLSGTPHTSVRVTRMARPLMLLGQQMVMVSVLLDSLGRGDLGENHTLVIS